mmetsp:Transcript_55486/g.143019  ORF Transcript_55486/g.143019 Transcript_55486/m.143019 type:complete len:236 (+) Transcript_55486:2-709(+)
MAVSYAAFAAAFAARMALAGIALTNVVVGTLSASESLSSLVQLSMSTLGSFAGDGAVAVSAPRWRVVGRNVASEWQVSFLGFFEDISCRTSIPAVPRRSDDRGKRLFNGHALSGPMRRDQAGYFALNAFEAGAAEWRSTAPCGAWSDECYIGFYWLSHQVAQVPDSDPTVFSTLRVMRRASVQPHCILLEQSVVSGHFAQTIAVQFKASVGAWQTILTRSGIEGGQVQLHLPAVV